MKANNTIEIKVSFDKHISPDGTVYQKCFAIPNNIYKSFKKALKEECERESANVKLKTNIANCI